MKSKRVDQDLEGSDLVEDATYRSGRCDIEASLAHESIILLLATYIHGYEKIIMTVAMLNFEEVYKAGTIITASTTNTYLASTVVFLTTTHHILTPLSLF